MVRRFALMLCLTATIGVAWLYRGASAGSQALFWPCLSRHDCWVSWF